MSKTLMLGERSKGHLNSARGVSGEFDSTWVGVVTGSPFTGWRVLGWTGEPPNNDPGQNSEVHFHGFAQFNSAHVGGITICGFADGSIHSIRDEISPRVFEALGSTRGGEIIPWSEVD